MRIVDSYWTNYEKDNIVDRKTAPPVLNEDLVKRINGRNGGPPTIFAWKGSTIYENNDVEFPEELLTNINPDDKLIRSASSSLAAIYHRDQCLPNTSYCCPITCTGLSVQIAAVNLPETIKEKCHHSVQFGVAIDNLFTHRGEVTEETNVVKDKIAYFCVFERDIGNTRLHIRKEIDFFLPLGDGRTIPVELKTRTRLGMNKMEFMYHLLPKLLTRCFLTDFYTVMIALREDRSASAVSKVMFIEDIRDLAGPEYYRRTKFFKFLINRLYKCPENVTEVRFSQESLQFFNGEEDILGNLAKQHFIKFPYITSGGRPDFVICSDPELENLKPTLCDMCVEKKWPRKARWRLGDKKCGVIFLAWRFQSLLDLLRTHEKTPKKAANLHVYLFSGENPPTDDEVEFVMQFHMGELMNVEVTYFDDVPDLEEKLSEWDLFETCGHSMVLLGEDRALPDCFAIRCTDIFRIKTFPIPVILDLITIPEKIAVFGSENECLQAAQKLSEVPFLINIKETFYFVMDKAVCSAIPLNNVFCVTNENDLRGILKDLSFPVVA